MALTTSYTSRFTSPANADNFKPYSFVLHSLFPHKLNLKHLIYSYHHLHVELLLWYTLTWLKLDNPLVASSCSSVSRHPPNGQELPGTVHWRDGIGICQIFLPLCHHQGHVPGKRLHKTERHWRREHIWPEFSRQELLAETHRTEDPEYGQYGAQYERILVLPVHARVDMARREVLCV